MPEMSEMWNWAFGAFSLFGGQECRVGGGEGEGKREGERERKMEFIRPCPCVRAYVRVCACVSRRASRKLKKRCLPTSQVSALKPIW